MQIGPLSKSKSRQGTSEPIAQRTATAGTTAPEYSAARIHTLASADLRNICILVVAFATVLLIASPARSFPITDDWIYSQSVRDLLNWSYKPHDWSQANALTHIAWGALFAGVFGLSFTVLAAANLMMAAACLVLFYVLLRQCDVQSTYALLGTVLLGFNPIFLHLSYSFMTDITFLTFMVAACLCFLQGMRRHSEGWLWAAAIATTLSYFTRQYGALLVPAALLYLWWSRSWTWRRAIAIAAIPVGAGLAYEVWSHAQPVSLVVFYLSGLRSAVQPVDFAYDHMQRTTWALATVGIFLIPLLRLPRRFNLWAFMLVPLGYFLWNSWRQFGSLFPRSGNTLDSSGFFMDDYNAVLLWPEWAWTLLGAGGAIAFTVFVMARWKRLQSWIRNHGWRDRTADPTLILYAFGLAVTVAIVTVTPLVLDRYFLPVLLVLIVLAMREFTQRDPEGSARWRWIPVAAIALFGVLAQRDYMAHASARWEAAQQLANMGTAPRYIDAGFEWQGYYLFDVAARDIRERGDFSYVPFPPSLLLDPVYKISDVPIAGYSQMSSTAYRSWLNGGQERHVLVLKRKQ